MALALLIVTIALIGWLAWGSWEISSGVYLRTQCRLNDSDIHDAPEHTIEHTIEHSVALTFDDGVDPVITPQILDILALHNAKATFFLIGDRAAQHPTLVRRIATEGHTIGNHSMHHRPTFPLQSTRQITAEIAECNALLASIIGTKPTLFRPPFGVTNPMISKAVRRSKIRAIGWSIRSYDTMRHPSAQTLERITRRLRPGDIILLHDNLPQAPALLEQLLLHISAKGYACRPL